MPHYHFSRRTSLALVAVLSGLAAAAPAQEYSVTDLGALHPDWQTLATGINASGQVAGASESAGFDQYRAVRYSGGVLQDLGALGGTLSEALGINDNGQVVGDATTTSDPLSYRAFLWTSGQMTNLDNFPGSVASQAWGLNNVGQVVGQVLVPVGQTYVFHAFLWQNGHMTDMSPDTFTHYIAQAINDSGVMVGTRDPGGNIAAAVKWNGSQIIDLNSLVNPPGSVLLQSARAVSPAGQIVGDAVFGGSRAHGYLFNNGQVTEIETDANIQTRAFALNSAGDVVGDFAPAAPYYLAAFRYRQGQRVDLNTLISPVLDVALTNAFGINDRGEIACSGRTRSGFSGFHAYLLRPPQPGDLNCDGAVTFDDIDPFVLALSNPAGYAAAYPGCLLLNGDCNSDGVVSFDDIDPFVALLSGS